MRRTGTLLFQGLIVLLLVTGITGCDTFEIFENEKEVNGTVEEVGADYVTLQEDDFRYVVSGDTEYDGISGLSDLSVGDQIEIEYENDGANTRAAIEIEFGDDDEDDDDGLFG